MAFELYVDVIPPEGGKIFVTHIFRGETEPDAQEVYKQHAAKCEFLTPAIADGRVQELLVEIKDADWPVAEEDEDEPDPDEEEDEEEDEDEQG